MVYKKRGPIMLEPHRLKIASAEFKIAERVPLSRQPL